MGAIQDSVYWCIRAKAVDKVRGYAEAAKRRAQPMRTPPVEGKASKRPRTAGAQSPTASPV